MTTLAVGHRLRKGRVSIANQFYSITAVTYMRQPVFNDLNSARALIDILRGQEALDRYVEGLQK